MPTKRLFAMGDPQAPFERVLDVLRAHGCLAAHDRLAPDVHLVVMGDYFDFGGRDERASAADAASRTLSWFLAHEEERVTLLAGNHDLARVGELFRFDDASFERAQAEADAGYWDRAPKRPEEEFRAEHLLPSWEIVARDFATFRERQRALVIDTLSKRRLRAAYAPSRDVLFVHAGITVDTLATLGIPDERDARIIAQRLNRALYEAFVPWRTNAQAPFFVPGLHAPGNQAEEGSGIFYHRPVADPAKVGGRRFHPSRLPTGLTQVVGHIGDQKTRELLGLDTAAARTGPIRHLVVSEGAFTYAQGLPADRPEGAATMVFIDGTLGSAAPAEYELYKG